MPYIPKNERARLRPQIEALKSKLSEIGYSVGRVNYVVCRLMLGFKAAKYSEHSAIHGAVQDAADEYKRRMLDPYEDKKIESEGDVFIEDDIGEGDQK